MLGCSFSFKTYANNVLEKAVNCSLRTPEVLMDADGHNYQGTVAPNCFKSYTNSWRPNLFQKKFCLMSSASIVDLEQVTVSWETG